MPFTAIVIDDELDNREATKDLLESYGVNVLATGTNGKEAIKLFKEYQPDVVFSDVSMADYDGIYGLKHIKKEDPDAIVIMITASIDSTIEKQLQKYEPSAIISKPYEGTHIVEMAKQVIQRKKPLQVVGRFT